MASTKEVTLILRAETLVYMDNYVKEEIGDEDSLEVWLSVGVPDCATKEDYLFIAEDEEEYNRCCRVFADLVTSEWADNRGVYCPMFNIFSEEYR